MSWIVSENSYPDREQIDFAGNKFLVGNGRIGYRGTLAEYDKKQKTATVVNGLYDRVGGKWREPVNGPNVLHCRLRCEGLDISALMTEMESHSQSLDLEKGLHLRETRFILPSGQNLDVKTTRFVSMADPDLLCLEYRYKLSQGGKIEWAAGILGDVWDINGPHLKDFALKSEAGILRLDCRTGEKNVAVSAVCIVKSDIDSERNILTGEEGKNILYASSFQAEPGREYVLYLFGALVRGDKYDDSSAHALKTALNAGKRGFKTVLADHTDSWRRLWNRYDISIEGDERAQQAMRFSLYHLLSIAPHHDKALSIAARGLSGQVYKGAVFWDTEMFMLPLFTRTSPDIAKALLRYRIETLPGALEKAKEYGYRGAFYPWESQEGGYDACTHFNVNNVITGRPVRTFFRDKQIHISADIALAFHDYVEWTGDLSILTEGGAEVILECARFFYSRCYYSPDRDRYEFTDVTGPDEYHEQVDNNFFTNVIIGKTFHALFHVLELLREGHPEFHRHFLDKELKKEELERFDDLRNKLYIPGPHEVSGVIPQFDRWFSLEDVAKEDLLKRKQHKQEYLGGGEGLARWTNILKQADVILALSLFPEYQNEEILERNYSYYEPRTEHGSSLSACAYGICAAATGRMEEAYNYFLKTSEIDMHKGAKQYVGDLYIGGTHPAANGGAWLTLMRGFLGMDPMEGRLSFRPRLPDHWRSLSFSLFVRGRELHIKVNSSEFSVYSLNTSKESAREALDISVNGKSFQLEEEKNITIKYKEINSYA